MRTGKAGAKTSPTSSGTPGQSGGFTAEERAAMRERAREQKDGAPEGEAVLLARIAELPEPDRSLGLRLHAVVTASAPDLTPRTWYGMPAWAKDGKVICFFTPGTKFKARYATFGFNDSAKLDDGLMWPTSFALTRLTSTEEKKIAELVKKAVG
ncbi:MAG: DUF1801 domain-containing protein [SAR202 cluster bacterium]|nr:DUF1801 domain-containing protein [SAR202 cluster bacterium]